MFRRAGRRGSDAGNLQLVEAALEDIESEVDSERKVFAMRCDNSDDKQRESLKKKLRRFPTLSRLGVEEVLDELVLRPRALSEPGGRG